MTSPLNVPDWFEANDDDALLAKSLDRGGETLAKHTWDVLQRLSEFIKLRPNLPQEIGQPRLWHILYWSAFLHDFGKAAQGFQSCLRDGPRWCQRHEVLSLAFIDWIEDGLSNTEQLWLMMAIVTHHKDVGRIDKLYYRDEEDEYDDRDKVQELMDELSPKTLQILWDWLNGYGLRWRDELDLGRLGVDTISVMNKEAAVAHVQHKGTKRIYDWLDKMRSFFEDLKDCHEPKFTIGTLTLRGYLTNADHCASSHRGELYTITLSADEILERKHIPHEELHQHQRLAEAHQGSTLLTAPTGSGKTEAALLWTTRQAVNSPNSPRMFYTLPYQASMNAMKLRLDDVFGKDDIFGKDYVGLQHGRAAMARYRMALEKEDQDADPATIAQQVEVLQAMAKLNYPPIRVFSPYQMLKGPYRLPGYEKLLSDYHHGLFIFDEIHAYDAKRLALILETMQYLREHFQAKFMIMSATFPSILKKRLYQALDITRDDEIRADDKLFKQPEFQRHRLRLCAGQLVENLETTMEMIRAGKSVLVVCNRVAIAQEVYDFLRDRKSSHLAEVKLLHGKFNMRDRSRLEDTIREQAGADYQPSQRFVLVATQAVEVSLDLDFDTIYTEPAPLDALLQRFGRVNRRGKKDVADVHVFLNWDKEKQDWVYKNKFVEKTLSILEEAQADGQLIDEKIIGSWIDQLYIGDIADEWNQEYEDHAKRFRGAWLDHLHAFEAITGRMEQKFYELFDGMEVLPASLVAEYEALKKDKRYLEAYELLVPIQYRQFKSIHPRRATPNYFEKNWPVVVDLPYTTDSGLDLREARTVPETEICTA